MSTNVAPCASVAQNAAALALTCLCLSGCAGPQVVVDHRSISDQANYQKDMSDCRSVAQVYGRAGATTGYTILGAVLGGGIAAGVAAASYETINPEATPYIVGGALIFGWIAGALSSSSTTNSQETILANCLIDRGYKAYPPN